MNKNICNLLFLFSVISLIFNNVPKFLQINFLGGSIGHQLVFYPIFIGLIYTIYCQIKYKNIFVYFSLFKKFLCLYFGILCLSLFIGLYNYPYYDCILAGSVNQIEKLPIALNFIHNLGININKDTLFFCWMLIRPLKGLILDTLYTFCGSYMFFCWYYKNWETGFNILIKGVICSLSIVIIYSCIDVLYLSGNEIGRKILEVVTPYIHEVKSDHNWWPPLLWKNQLRSVFSEPSHVGNYIAITLPILWFLVLKNRKYVTLSLLYYILFTCIIFLTQSRTAYAMYLGITFLFVLGISLVSWQQYYKKIILLLLTSCFSFFLSVLFINQVMVLENNESIQLNKNKITATQIISNNLGSLSDEHQRSNGARYAMLKSHVKMGVSHPILGLGVSLNDSYSKDYLTLDEKKDQEINMWLQDQKKDGLLKYPLGAMNEYVERFSSTGFLGLLVFLFPFFYGIYELLKIIMISKRLEYVCLLIALIGAMVAGMNGSLTLLYSIWIILGLTYAVICSEINNRRT